VEEAVVTRVISDLRRALRQTDQQVWIETVPKFGYRFAAEVTVTAPEPEPAPAAPRHRISAWLVVPAVLAAVAILVG
jgi:DNA-binding winged helix-turn-helix (wHTH) protein